MGSCRDVTSDSVLKLSNNFRYRSKACFSELSTNEEEKLSNEYIQKKILHRNRKK